MIIAHMWEPILEGAVVSGDELLVLYGADNTVSYGTSARLDGLIEYLQAGTSTRRRTS